MECNSVWSLFLLLLTTGKLSSQGSKWSWRCINNKCVKNETLAACQNDDLNNMLEICRLTCGAFGGLWPKPTGKTDLVKDIIPIHPDRVRFDLQTYLTSHEASASHKLMKQMSLQFIQDMRTLCTGYCLRILDTEIVISIKTSTSDSDLTWQTDESYTLEVNTDGFKIQVDIDAVTVFGARHGLQTLIQLMTSISKNNTSYLVMVRDAFVQDRPAYPHRGLLIDTSRHYLHLDTIRRTIDAMSYSKLNVLHWHATDSHSFPLKIPRVPELSKYGAYSSEEIYTLQDISEIINYGKKRGVRLIMEIDSPAHAGNGWQWGPSAGFGNLAVCVNKAPWRKYCIQPPCGQLNPANSNMYKVMGLLFRDLMSILPKGEIIHMGGDEVKFTCWNETEEIINLMEKERIERSNEGFLLLWSSFHNKLLQIFDNIVGNPEIPTILWSSHLTLPDSIEQYLDKDRFIIQTWLPANDTTNEELLEKGYKIIASTKDAWYLDHGVWGITKYYPWSKVYDNRIPSATRGVYGGEVCMWGEYVDDSAIDSRIWPRAAAAAERLWSNPKDGSVAAQYRFLHHRNMLVRMGIRAESILPEWCYQNEDLCL